MVNIFKKIISISLITLMVFSIIATSSAYMTLKFDNRNSNDKWVNFYNEITLYEYGAEIWHEKKHSIANKDKYFKIPNDVIRQTTYMEVSASSYFNTRVSHHITVSDDFKTNIPGKMTFRVDSCEYNNCTFGLWMTFQCHQVKAFNGENNSISWTLRRLD